MKNFRKVLALVLVVATIFSFTAMASAAGYKDAADVSSTYAQAVDVLSAVGVLNGYEDGSFKPTSDISREEMAKMIAVLANAGDDVSKLYATACTFADVAKDRWSASYVAYCAKTGIVAGRSATTFDPYGKVTGLETAKMLLVVLGFSAEEQGYVGADWKINVLRDAKNVGLLNGFEAGYDVDAAITRQEAAHMMLNALMTKVVVGVLSENIIKVTNAVYKEWDGATLIDASKKGLVNLYGNVVVSSTTLWEALYGGNLFVTYTARDCYGRPAVKWSWKDAKGKVTDIGIYPATPVWTSTSTSKAAIDKQVASYLEKTEVKYFSDGAVKADATGFGGNGALVELYVVGTKLTVVEVNTYIGYVGQMNTAKGTFELIGADGSKRTAKNNYGFKPADEGTVVLYWVCADGVHNVEVAEPVTLTVHAVRGALHEFCDTDEKVHAYAKTCASPEFDADDVGGDFYVFTDKYGYVLLTAPVDTTTYGVAVLRANSAKGTDPVTTEPNNTVWTKYVAKFIDFEANPAVSDYITTDKATFELDVTTNPTVANGHDILVTYTEGKDGARLKAVAATEAEGWGYYLNEATGRIDGLNKAGNDNTQYLLRVFNHKTGAYEYKYFDGKEAIDATYLLDNLQYIANGRYLTYVYAEADYAVTSSLAFVMNFYTDETWVGHVDTTGAPTTYHLYKAYVNGEEALVAYEYPLPESYMKVYASSYVLIQAETHDQLPIYMATDLALESEGYDFIIKGNELTWKNGDDFFGAMDMAADAKIVIVTDRTPIGGAVSTVVLDSYDDLVDYLGAHGWANTSTYGWYDVDSNGDVNLLYLYVKAVK